MQCTFNRINMVCILCIRVSHKKSTSYCKPRHTLNLLHLPRDTQMPNCRLLSLLEGDAQRASNLGKNGNFMLFRKVAVWHKSMGMKDMTIRWCYLASAHSKLSFEYLDYYLRTESKSFQLTQIWQVLRKISRHDTGKISIKNFHHERNGSRFCEAPLKCNFTTWMSG